MVQDAEPSRRAFLILTLSALHLLCRQNRSAVVVAVTFMAGERRCVAMYEAAHQRLIRPVLPHQGHIDADHEWCYIGRLVHFTTSGTPAGAQLPHSNEDLQIDAYEYEDGPEADEAYAAAIVALRELAVDSRAQLFGGAAVFEGSRTPFVAPGQNVNSYAIVQVAEFHNYEKETKKRCRFRLIADEDNQALYIGRTCISDAPEGAEFLILGLARPWAPDDAADAVAPLKCYIMVIGHLPDSDEDAAADEDD